MYPHSTGTFIGTTMALTSAFTLRSAANFFDA
jgi:hypothetical protein